MKIENFFPLVSLTPAELKSLLPLFILAFGALVALLLGTHKEKGRDWGFLASVSTILLSIYLSSLTLFAADVNLHSGTLVFDSFTRTLSLMVQFFALLGILITHGQDKKEGILSEIYALMLFSVTGMILMLSTTHLLFMFIALEIMSLAVYVMVGMRRSSKFSAEAGLKYFILGGIASALLLYGTALIFGATGSFELIQIRSFLMHQQEASMIFYIGCGLVVSAMLFKIGAFPFHGWVADVYQGATTSVTAYMGAAVKFTAFIAFLRIAQNLLFIENFPGLHWFASVLWVISAASMIYGNIVAISQYELKRMLAFSTIAHSGYLLMGLFSLNDGDSAHAMVMYLFFYAIATLGAFAVIASFEEKNQKDLTLDQIAGLGLKYPALGVALTIFLFAMAGIPMTSGFIGKYGVFSSAVNAGEVPLVIIAVLTSVIAAYYYLRVIVFLFMKEPTKSIATAQGQWGASFVAFISAIATLQFGLFPRVIMHFVKLMSAR